MIDKEKEQKQDLIFKVSAVSHDLKTPLTVIQGNSELLLYSKLDEAQKQHLTDIVNASHRMGKYFDQLISYSKTLYDDKSEWEDYSVSEVLETIRQEVTFLTEGKAVFTFVNNVSGDRSINIHMTYVIRAITNIINNAIEYAKADDKQIKMTVDIIEDGLAFTVWNNGSLFSEDLLENYGTLLYQQNKARTSDNEHYGIGLAFIKRVAELHNGKLKLANVSDGVEAIFEIGL